MHQEASCNKQPHLELWGGVECTVNRVGDEYFEQLGRTGHLSRIQQDLTLFAELGITAFRQPVLWESTAPDGASTADWSVADAALQRLRELNVRPIVGLVHHGSGPRHTNLLDPKFGAKLAQYAEMVARRYPWIEDYTPVNEPLTTARFSALYGHWYPHRRDDFSFASALLNQCRGIVLSMEAVRKVNSSARLVQTDDLGKICSTPKLAYQAEFENERRWAGYDLLCGKINREHMMWSYFTWAGIDEDELQWFLDHPCPPAVIGINHYLSGNRYLDEHLHRYPADCRGGNGRDSYADVLAARVMRTLSATPGTMLMEAWKRYQIPVAVTECHNGCTREEQMRWFLYVWRGAELAIANGASVLAVTAWSLLGAFDWNELVTKKQDHYEPGVYDIRSGAPRENAMAKMIKELALGQQPEHPLLDVPGWWRRPQRFIYGIEINESGHAKPARRDDGIAHLKARPVLITGARGTLGRAFARICEARGVPYRLLDRQAMDIADPNSVQEALDKFQPWAVINAAGYVRVDDAEIEPEKCFRENTWGPLQLARQCGRRGIQLLTFSSDLVFDGEKAAAYVEGDAVCPLNEYGRSKAQAEGLVLEAMPSALVIRTSAFFGPWDEYNFVTLALHALESGQEFVAADDVIISPTYVPDLVNHSLDLLIDKQAGIWHLANVGEISWAGLADLAAELAGISTRKLRTCSQADLRVVAHRPLYSALTSERAGLLPKLEDALRRYMAERQVRAADSVEIAA